jgi:hypothetical protein
MMVDPQSSVVPTEMFAGVVMALKEWAAQLMHATLALGTLPGPRLILSSGAYTTRLFQERPVQIGVHDGFLTGVLTEPVGGTLSTRGILLLNSGSVHCIGPNRLWVRLARDWATRGLTVLRLDLSGIGDSPPRTGHSENVVYSKAAGDDVAAAVRYMQEELRVGDCQLLGLCSGAFHGFKAAVNGVPLTATVLINPLTFFWELGKPLEEGIKDYEVVEQASNYKRKIFALATWQKLLSGKVDILYLLAFAGRKLGSLFRPSLEGIAHLLHIPLKNDLSRELVGAAHMCTQHFVFAVGDPGIDLLRSQGKRSLAPLLSKKRVTIDFVADADHTFTRLEARDRLVEVLDRLMYGKGRTK